MIKPKFPCFLLQGGSMECRAIHMASMTADDVRVRFASSDHAEAFRREKSALLSRGAHGCVPVGSVEFVRQCMQVIGIEPPAPLEAFTVLSSHLHRTVLSVRKRDLDALYRRRGGRWFVKPYQVKLFSGFEWSPDLRARLQGAQETAPADADYLREQLNALDALPDDVALWASEAVRFVREDRVYVLNGQIVGSARYDDGEDDAPAPQRYAINTMVKAYAASEGAPVAFSLDVGVLENGKTALVEINDAWALGLYRDMRNVQGYMTMLASRWQEILTKNREHNHGLLREKKIGVAQVA